MRGGGAAPKPPAGCKAPCTPGRVLRTRLQARHRNGTGKPPPPTLTGSAGEARAVGSGQRASARRATGGARKPSRATSRLCGQIPRRPLPKTPPPALSACAAKPPSIQPSKLPIAREARAVGSGQRASARRATGGARKPSRATLRLRGENPGGQQAEPASPPAQSRVFAVNPPPPNSDGAEAETEKRAGRAARPFARRAWLTPACGGAPRRQRPTPATPRPWARG